MPDKKRILFVDDEPNILSGLRRMLRSMRREWDMVFAGSGAQALDLLAQAPFDVIVTDMRMPGMDGAELLKTAMERYPRAVRIVLSGQADRDAILHAMGPIHQYLSKPCDADTLKNTVNRACTLGGILANEHLKQLISQIETLPSLPSLYDEVVDELQSPDASAKSLGEIISLDMGMSAKVLQLVNSAFFGLRPHIPDPAQAVILLGLDTVKILGLSVQAFTQFDRNRLEALSLAALWQHSVRVAQFAQKIALAEGADQKSVDYAFIAGLLHDVGKLVLASQLPEKYSQTFALANGNRPGRLVAETKIFGATHAQVGAYLLGLWGLPEPVVEALIYHHEPAAYQVKTFSPLTAVHAANFLEHKTGGNREPVSPADIDYDYLAELDLIERFPVWREICYSM